MKTLNTVQNKMANSISIKVVIIGMLSLLLLIPNGMIQNLIKERQSLRDEGFRKLVINGVKIRNYAGRF